MDLLAILPVFIFSFVYACAILYNTWRPRETEDNRLVSVTLSLICIAVEFLTIYHSWGHLALTLQLVEIGSSTPFLCYDSSKFIELSCDLLQIWFTNFKIRRVHMSLEIPLLILADYAYKYSNVQPMILLMFSNSVLQISVHISHILHTFGISDKAIEKECGILTETFIDRCKISEYIAILVCLLITYKRQLNSQDMID